ncbi:hypothetical protein ACS016_09875 [Aeromonas veronii]|uniref:hypothetical protein n=1 Tax=Aeromonas veronii TaxID=654 RepID=UPI0038DAF57A
MKNIHCVTDKALFDALNQSKITPGELGDLFLDRGIIVSKSTTRKDLAMNFSRFHHDYLDHQKIASYLGVTSRRERTTTKRINNKVDTSDVLSAAESLKLSIESENDVCSVLKDENKIIIDIQYLSTDYTKSDFRQVVTKNATIIIESNYDHLNIRRPDNEHTEAYEDIFLAYLENLVTDKNNGENPETLNVNEISLINHTDPNTRTEFFIKLISHLKGFKLDDVTDAYVYHPKPDKIDEEDGDIDTGVHISKASLKGEGVLRSEELSSLYDRGFYLWKVRWQVRESQPDPDIYDLEAQFSNQIDFSGFSYATKGIKKYKGNGEYNKSFVGPSKTQEQMLCKLIENAAYTIMLEIDSVQSGGVQ